MLLIQIGLVHDAEKCWQKDGGNLPEKDTEKRLSQLVRLIAMLFQKQQPWFRGSEAQWDQYGYCAKKEGAKSNLVAINQKWISKNVNF